jgi:hypothetical protein
MSQANSNARMSEDWASVSISESFPHSARVGDVLARCRSLRPEHIVAMRCSDEQGTSWCVCTVAELRRACALWPADTPLGEILCFEALRADTIDRSEEIPVLDAQIRALLVLDHQVPVRACVPRLRIDDRAAGEWTLTPALTPHDAATGPTSPSPLMSSLPDAGPPRAKTRSAPRTDARPPERPGRAIRHGIERAKNATTRAIAGESSLLHWNTRFPGDTTAEKLRLLVTGVPYTLETVLGVAADPDSLTAAAVSEDALSSDGETVRIAFQVEAQGAGVRMVGSDGEFAARVRSEPLACTPGKGTDQARFELRAETPGPVVLDLSILLGGVAVAVTCVNLTAMAAATGAAAPAPRISMQDLEAWTGPDVVIEIRRRDDAYRLEIQSGIVVAKEVDAASPAAAIEATLRDCRARLVTLAGQYQPDSRPGTPFAIAAPASAMQELAVVGRKLHQAIFGDPHDGGVSADLRNLSREIARLGENGARLHIDSEFLPIPWGVLCDDLQDATPASFWGGRFQITRLVRGGPISSMTRRSLDLDIGGGLRACIRKELDHELGVSVVEPQFEFFTGLGCAEPITRRAALEAFLDSEQAEDCRLLYILGHAWAASEFDEHGRLRSMPPLEQARLQLDEPISAYELRTHHRLQQGQPLVFLNACSSALGDPGWPSPFLTLAMNHWGACGLVGTDWQVPAVFADAFARAFLHAFIREKKPLGLALHGVTRAALAQGNPFGLTYALYAPPALIAGVRGG